MDTDPPGFASAAVDGATLTVTFDEDLDAGSAPAGSAFTVTAAPADGEARTIAGTGTAGVAGAAVTVTLVGAVLHGETLTVAYAPPEDGRLRDLAGNAAAAFSGESAENGTAAPAPAVEAVALVSDPGADRTYAAGDAIRVQVTFGAAVTVDTAQGTPRLKLDLGGEAGERWAAYASGDGTTALTFAYTAVAGDASAGGVAVLADTLELDGGTIVSAAGADAALSHAGLNPDAGHKVDANPPGFASAAVDGATLTVTFDEDLDADSASAASAFTVTAAPADGEARAIAGTGTANVAGAAVTVTLAGAVAHGETLTVAYAPPTRTRSATSRATRRRPSPAEAADERDGRAGAGGRGGGAGLGPGRGRDLRGRRRHPGAGDLRRPGDGGRKARRASSSTWAARKARASGGRPTPRATARRR